MSDSLRDRIAAAITDAFINGGVSLRYGAGEKVQIEVDVKPIADAVIAALGLELTATSNACDGRFKSWSVEGYWEERKAVNE